MRFADLWAGLDPDEPVLAPGNLRLYEVALLVLMACERLRECRVLGLADVENLHVATSFGLLGVYALCSRRPGPRRCVVAGFVCVQLSVLIDAFPWTGNHLYLSLYLLALLVVFDRGDPEERRLIVGATRWIAITVFFFAGVQKLVHGVYFRGETLSYLISFHPGFRAGLGPLLSDAELLRLTSYTYQEGAGPFRAQSLPLIALSNLTYLTEMGAALGLAWRRTRVPALVLGVGFLALTEAMALELYFGLIFGNALLLFAPRPWHRVALPIGGLVLLWILGMRFGVFPALEHT